MSRFLLISDDGDFERRVQLAFGGSLNGDLRRVEAATLEAGDLLRALHTALDGEDGDLEVLVVGTDVPASAGLGLAERLELERPDLSVVLVAPPEPELWSTALRAGVRDVLDPQSNDDEIREVLRRASDAAVRRRQSFTEGSKSRQQRGRVISLISPKGGSGKTTLATNLAVGLAATAPGQVVLVDADLQFGDAASGLQLVPESTIAQAVPAGAAGDAMGLKVYLTAHSADLFVLCAPDSPAEGERITGEQVAQIIDVLASEFRYVVIDTAAGLHEAALAAADVSTDLVLLASMDVPSIRSLTKVVGALDGVGLVTQRRHFVLNRADSRVGLDTNEVASTVGMPVDVALPSSRQVPLSTNEGHPVLLSAPRSPIGRQLQGLVDRFTEQPSDQGQPRRFSLRSRR